LGIAHDGEKKLWIFALLYIHFSTTNLKAQKTEQ
jgi:hypothetical protein